MSLERRPHHWIVKLQAESGEVSERPVSSYHDPKHELTRESIATQARLEAQAELGVNVQALDVVLGFP